MNLGPLIAQSLRAVMRYFERIRRFLIFPLLIALIASFLGKPTITEAATFVVDRTDDDPSATACTASPNDCSLRGAIIAANADALQDTITLPAGTYTLTQVGAGPDDGDLDLDSSLIINGAGSGSTTIDGNGAVTGEGVLTIFSGHQVEINDVTLTGGSGFGGIYSLSELTLNNAVVSNNQGTCCGGGIYTSGTLIMDNVTVSGNSSNVNGGGGIYLDDVGATITNSTITGNQALSTGDGGGMYAHSSSGPSTYTIEDSMITSNSAGSSGGGLYIVDGTLNLLRVQIEQNDATNNGGGIYQAAGSIIMEESSVGNNSSNLNGGGLFIAYNVSSTVINRSTISENTSNSTSTFGAGGGGIYLTGASLTLTNSTVSGNSAKNHGGGIFNNRFGGTLQLDNVTITDNTPDSDSLDGGDGGGVHGGSGAVNMHNSIIAGNDGDQCTVDPGGSLVSLDYNLSSDSTCQLTNPNDQPNTNPLLGLLSDNGGETRTHALLPGSPAIDAAETGGAACPSVDQRGTSRPVGPACDLGAFEAPIWIFLPLIVK